jgi:hypothetical protein
MVIMDNQGKKVQQGYILDLAEKSDDGQYKRSIIKAIDPNKYRINLAEYML